MSTRKKFSLKPSFMFRHRVSNEGKPATESDLASSSASASACTVPNRHESFAVDGAEVTATHAQEPPNNNDDHEDDDDENDDEDNDLTTPTPSFPPNTERAFPDGAALERARRKKEEEEEEKEKTRKALSYPPDDLVLEETVAAPIQLNRFG